MIEGLSHITFIVKDLDRMEELLTTVLDARKVFDSGDDRDSKERFFDIAGLWIAIIEGEPPAGESYNHVALKIADADYDEYLMHIKSLGLRIREGRPRGAGKGRSIYFYDHDNHLFEMRSGTLEERLVYQAR